MSQNECAGAVSANENALARDTTRFQRFYPNGRAKIKTDATDSIGVMNSIELIEAARAEKK